MLYEVGNAAGRKLWCGPTAVAAITGLDVTTVHMKIPRPRVMGTAAHELWKVMMDAGWKVERCSNPHPDEKWHDGVLSFRRWSKSKHRDANVAYLVMLTDHWVAVKGRWMCDTYTQGKPVRLTQGPHKRCRVQRVYRVYR